MVLVATSKAWAECLVPGDGSRLQRALPFSSGVLYSFQPRRSRASGSPARASILTHGVVPPILAVVSDKLGTEFGVIKAAETIQL